MQFIVLENDAYETKYVLAEYNVEYVRIVDEIELTLTKVREYIWLRCATDSFLN